MGDSLFFGQKRTHILVALFVLMFFGQSCQIDEEPASISPPVHVSNAVSQSFQNSCFTPACWLEENWWEMFDDLQLNALMTQALANNPTMQMAIERVGIARDCAKNALSPMLPKVDATFEEFFAGFSWNDRGVNSSLAAIPDRIVPKWINILSTLLNFRWSIDIWGKQRKLFQAAIDESKMQMAEAAYVKLMISTQVASAYFDLQYFLNLQDIQNDILQSQTQLLNLQKQIFQNALVDARVVQHQEKSVLKTEQELLSTNENIEMCVHQIKALIGLSADDLRVFEVPNATFGSQFPFPKEIPTNFLLRRPDVVAKIWAVQAATKRVKSAEVAFLPSIDLGSFSGYLKLNWDTLLKPKGWFSSIAPMASLPIFHGLELNNNLSLSVRRYNMAVSDYHQTLLNAAKEVVDAITAFRVSDLTEQNQIQILKKSDALLELATQRYQAGLNTLVDVLEAKIGLMQEEIQYAAIERMHVLAALNLIKALGGGYCAQQLDEEKPT